MKFEGLPDDVIVAKAVAVLRSIFGDPNVPEVFVMCPFCHTLILSCVHSVIRSFCHVFILLFCSPRRAT